MKIVTIVGARPQFIKVTPVSRALSVYQDIQEILVHTGQHFDAGMSDVFFSELELASPDYNLGINGGSHGMMTGLMLQSIEPLLEKEHPDYVLVYGDTNSTLAGALAASKMHIPVAHVEAGLRSFNRRMPEEQNRVVTDHLSDLLFTPTDIATNNLFHEGIADRRIHQVGDVMFDAVLMFRDLARERSDILHTYGLEPKQYVLATVHRAENTDDGNCLRAIVNGLESVARDLPVVLPLHPRTRAAIQRDGLMFSRVKLIDPVGYLDMVALECQAAVIATDSGGVQKEAYYHGVPCVTLREETEWVELIEMGWNILARPGKDDIALVIRQATGNRGIDGKPYGEGDAAKNIAREISHA